MSVRQWTEEEAGDFNAQIDHTQRQSIYECVQYDAQVRDLVIQNNGQLPEPRGSSYPFALQTDNLFKDSYHVSEDEEEKEDYVAKTAHTVQMIDFLKYKRATEGPKITNKTTFNQSFQAPTGAAAPAGLKYISRRDKVARLMATSPVYTQPLAVATETGHAAPQRSPVQQFLDIPQEQAMQVEQEQQFVTSFEPDVTRGESPQRLTVRMERMSPDDRLREQFSHSKSKQLAQRSNIHNDRTFEEKNFVKKNLNNYSLSPSPQGRQSQYEMYDIAQEVPVERPPPNAFGLSKDAEDLADDLNDSFVARLNKKFRAAYVEANSRKPGQLPRKKQQQQGGQTGSPQREHREVPFVQDDTIRESQLIASLMSPHTNELTQVNERSGPLSTSVREFRSAENTVSMDQMETQISSPPRGGSSRRRSPARRVREPDSEARKQSPDKRAVQMNDLFAEFDKEFVLKRGQELEEAEKEQTAAQEMENKTERQTSPKRRTNEPKRQLIE